jgi:hypothetical protein
MMDGHKRLMLEKQKLDELAAESTSMKDFASKLGFTYITARNIAELYGVTVPDGRVGVTKSNQVARNADIYNLRQIHGLSYSAIGKKYGITRQRAHGIYKAEHKKLALTM